MKRTAMFVIGVALAYGAAWLGQQVAVQLPTDPSTVSELWRQIYWSESAITLYAAMASAVATAILILYHVINFARSKSDVWTSNGFVFMTMLTFVGAAYSFGAFAHPFDYGQDPRLWFALGRQWNVALAAILAPSVALFVLLICELFARIFKRKDPLQEQIDRFDGQVSRLATLRETMIEDRKLQAEMLKSIFDWIRSTHNNLETHRNAFGERMGKLEPAVGSISESLTEHRKGMVGRIDSNILPALDILAKSLGEHRTADLEALKKDLVEQLSVAIAAHSGPRLVEPPAKSRSAGGESSG